MFVWRWDDFINAIDSETGTLRWQYQVTDNSTVEVSTNNQLFIATGEDLISIDVLTGRETWRKSSEWNRDRMYAHLGMLFVYDHHISSLHVLDAATGEPRWSFDSVDARFNNWIDVSITQNTVYITGYNDEDSDFPYQDDLFHTCVLDAAQGLEQARTRSSGNDLLAIDDLYAGLLLAPVRKRWSEYDRRWQPGRTLSTHYGVIAESEAGKGIACYDFRTDEEHWTHAETNTDFPFVSTQENIVVSLNDDASCIIAIAADSGTETWRCRTVSNGWAYPIASSDDIVYVLERTQPSLYALTASTGAVLWVLPLHDSLDTCMDADMRALNIGEYSRNLHAHIEKNRLYIRTGHILCAVQLPEP